MIITSHLARRAASAAAAIGLVAASLVVAPAAQAAAAAPIDAPSRAPSPTVDAPLPDPKIKGTACTTKKGVTVVVDFRDLHDAKGKRLNLVKIGCARGPQESGITAIQDAGFKLQHSGGLVCRLDQKPLPEQTDCASEGYWSYWHATRRSSWEYSNVGAGGWAPPAGSLEGWAWNWYDEAEADPRVDPSDLFRATG